MLVSAALAAFSLVLYSFGLLSAGFAALNGFLYFVLVSIALGVCPGLLSLRFGEKKQTQQVPSVGARCPKSNQFFKKRMW